MDVIIPPIVENLPNNDSVETSAIDNLPNDPQEPDPNEKGSANSSLDKMESLIVEEDDDDGLGTESLRISGSEDENDNDENISPIRSKKRPTQKIIDSDEDDTEEKVDKDEISNNDIREDVDQNQDKEEIEVEVKKTAKFSALIDSESEPEATPEDIPEKVDEKVKSKVNKQKVQKTNKKKKKKELDKTKKRSSSQSFSSDSENEEQSKDSKKKQKPSKISNLIDSESESSNANSDHEEQDQQSNTPAPKRPKKPQRASAKKAMTEMQALQSETQRLYRETQVSIPYHKPKRHTLKEFLNRNTINKPSLNLTGHGKSLKMSPEELEEYAKQLEERAKEATEFFKSESEDELKDIEEKDDTTDKQSEETPMETSTIEQQASETQPEAEAEKPLNTEEIDKILQEHEFISQPSTQELLDIGIPTQREPETISTPTPSTSNEVPKETEVKPSSSTKPSALAELKRRLLAEKNIPLVPKLKGDSNMMIDFETGDMFARKPTGVENLFERFMKSNKNNKKKPEETTPSQELQTTLKVAVIQETNKEKEPKPGAAYMKLKENLRTLITRKRKEDFKRKIEETKEEQDEYNKCCGLDEDEGDEDDEEEKEREERRSQKKTQQEIVIDEEENEINPEEYEEENEDEDKNDDDEEMHVDGEQIDEDVEENKAEDEDGNESEGSSSSSEEEEDAEDQSKRKHRVIKAFEDSDEEAGNPDLNTTSTGVLFAEEEQKDPEEIEDELLDLCSGQFAETQRPPVISQIPVTQTPGNVADTELECLCSGVFNAEPTQTEDNQVAKTEVEPTQKTVLRIVSSDEEKEPEEEQGDDVSTEAKKRKVKKLKKRKRKHVKLGFSDDEDEDEQNSEEEEIEEEQEDEEIPQTFIDYDSEENEIEVQMSKKDRVKEANTFFEKEAELSESEWGSADEDEQNMDRYDKELGDEDEFDQQKLHTELEQIHMRKVLDDDIREVKKIQEMLFDDEEQDGVGRQRKFRWKNIESGFSLDDPAGGDAENDDQVDSADDEEEIKWRKMRFEREQLLMQKSKEEILAEVSATELGKKLLNTMEFNTKSSFVIEKEVLVAKEYKPPSFLIKQNDLSNLRNSFLNHDKEVLAKIAENIEKSGDYQRSDNEQVHKKASKNGQFVFVPLTEEENELRKRKAEEPKDGNAAKKMKTLSKKPLLLDRLL